MGLLKRIVAKSELLVPVSLAACAGLMAIDMLIFFAFGRRPFISYAESGLVVWAVLIAGAWVFAARWLVVGEKRARFSLAGAITLMLALSALHPFYSGALVPVYTPSADPVVGTPASSDAIVEFHGGPLSRGTAKSV
jgi:hypothetical protein